MLLLDVMLSSFLSSGLKADCIEHLAASCWCISASVLACMTVSLQDNLVHVG